jgi:hypothetical protein
MIGFNGGLIGKTRTTSIVPSVPGVWTANEQVRAKAVNLWPGAGILTNGLILHLDAGQTASYPGSGTAWTDLSTSGNNGTLTNGPTFDSANGGSIVFDGTNDYAAIPLITSAIVNVTLQCWAYVSTSSMKGPFMGVGTSGNGWCFGVGSGTIDSLGNEITALISGVRHISTSTNYGTGWKFVTFVLNASSVPSIYVGSTFIGSYSGSNPNTPTTETTVGAEASNSRFFGGNVAQAIAYNRALSATDIQTNFDITKGRYGL